MILLDIDLDFFLSQITRRRSDGARLTEEGIVPWSEVEVRCFLESQCGLSNKSRRLGTVFDYHDEAFWHWKGMIERGQLEVPFELVHADAHADLGMGWGDVSTRYIMREILHRPLGGRVCPKTGGDEGMTEGSHLAFAIACRWIRKLTYVHHPKLNRELGDIGPSLMKGFDIHSGFLQFKKYAPSDLKGSGRLEHVTPLSLEPEVPLVLVPCSDYRAEAEFDYVFLSKSPAYTPPAADALIPVIRDYIAEVPPPS